MADTGWVIAGSGRSDSTVGTEPWANPGNVTADDSTNADADNASSDEQTEYIVGYNFGLSVPTGATIDGIEIRGQFSDNLSIAYLNYAQVYHPSSGFGDDQETGTTTLTGSEVNYDYGGATELHGLSWTPANVNDSNFGVAFAANASHVSTFVGNPRCDAIWVKVYYTESAGGTFDDYIGPRYLESKFTNTRFVK